MATDRREHGSSSLSANDRLVLDVVRGSTPPISAYDILTLVRPKRPRVAPPTISWALARLAALGLVHRVETLGAWFAPAKPGPQGGIIAICDDCGEAGGHAALEALSAIAGALGATGFHPARPIVEVHGRCDGCDAAAQAGAMS